MSSPNRSAAPLTPALLGEQAVLGAGAAGLVAARELLREGHRVVVFEQSARLGGVWAYSPGNRPPRCSRVLPRSHNLCVMAVFTCCVLQ
jgi:heterodisulfide reductase subunit A-like polyferredoxin